ncbi:MAG TPA: VWA domain-containing protein [Terriglobia bacterium]
MKRLCIVVALLGCAAPSFAPRGAAQNLKVDVDLVLVNATVTERGGGYVIGLKKKDFHVWEDKVEQQVASLSTESVPISVAIVFDISYSMQSFGAYARQAVLTFLRASNPEDEYCLILFSDKPRVQIDLTKDISKVEQLPFIPYEAVTALYDGVYLGMETLKKASYPKRALIVVTDGGETHSRSTFSNLKDSVGEQNVQIFSIGVEGRINDIVQMTGGYAFHGASLDGLFEKIAIELKNEYVIGYHSTNQTKNGKWRKIELKVDPPPGLSKLSIRGKTGYHAAAQ